MAFAIPLRAESLRALIENPLFLAPLSSLLIAQLIKMTIILLRGKRRSGRELLETAIWRTGGMPSSHVALVTSLAVSAAYREGINSNLFIITLFLALIFMRDAMGVRRSSGLQARALNFLGRQLAEKSGFEYHPVKEVHGHSPMEVVVGSLLGFFISAAYEFL
jgi:acid phosphatase family membrane protein YuiD